MACRTIVRILSVDLDDAPDPVTAGTHALIANAEITVNVFVDVVAFQRDEDSHGYQFPLHL